MPVHLLPPFRLIRRCWLIDLQQRTQDTPLGCPCVKSLCAGEWLVNPDSLSSARQDVQDPVAEMVSRPKALSLVLNQIQ
jgi:hypothetical protein